MAAILAAAAAVLAAAAAVLAAAATVIAAADADFAVFFCSAISYGSLLLIVLYPVQSVSNMLPTTRGQ